MRIPTRRPARISAARTTWPPRETVPARVTVRSTSTASPSVRPGGSGGGPAGTAPSATRWARSVTLRCERTRLDPGAADGQVDQVAVDPEPRPPARPGPGPSQNCCPADRMFPDGGTTWSSSTGATRPTAAGDGDRLARCRRADGRVGAAASVGGSHSSTSVRCSAGTGCEPVAPGSPAAARPGPGAAGRCCSRSTHASTAACAASRLVERAGVGRGSRGGRCRGTAPPSRSGSARPARSAGG